MTCKTTYDRSAIPSTNTGPEDPVVIGQSLDPAATIMLADDHRLVRSALRSVLESEGWIDIVAEAADVEETIRRVRGHKPDVLVLDLNMPGGSSLEAIPHLLDASPRTAIVVLTMQNEPELARAALRAGASAFVLKEAADTELINAIQAARNGHAYLNPQLGVQIAAEPPAELGLPDHLTERQLEVLRLLVSGYTNLEIADQLSIAQRTVESHRGHIQHKTHHKSRADLVAYARDHRLVDY